MRQRCTVDLYLVMPLKNYIELCSADFEESLLFQPLCERKKERRDVGLLSVTYSVFRQVLSALIQDWLCGLIGEGAPTDSLEVELVTEVNKQKNGDSNKNDVKSDKDATAVYNDLVQMKVPGHLKIVASHRKWIRSTFSFLKTVGVNFSDEMLKLVHRHDLSKFSHEEVLGYAIMFGDGRVDYRQLQTDEEKFEWENSLENHYSCNPHHPEYFYPKQENGTRDRIESMRDLDPKGQDYLDESIIDMLASRGERYLAEDPVISVRKWFDIPERFLQRYSCKDQIYVTEKLREWETLCEKFFEVKESLKMDFDSREIVLEEKSRLRMSMG